MFEPLYVGCKVELIPKLDYTNDNDTKISYVSQILDMTEEYIICAMPIYEGRLIPLEIDSQYDAYFFVQNNFYKTDCTVVDRGKTDNIHTAVIRLDTKLVKFQRREYYRLECTTSAIVKTLSEKEREYYLKFNKIPENIVAIEDKCIIIDISGGGVRILSKIKYEKNQYIAITFPIMLGDETKLKTVVGRVVMSMTSANNSLVFDNRIQFVEISNNDREEIIKYIFQQQRMLRKKERG
ncbi:MAG: flagellar brake protein [Eubacteriales bacterium]|nr:flagellar brake protein [Eubacteriales bacterium]